MQIPGRFIDDFKTDRKGISPPLPAYLKIVPIIFFLTILATILLNGLFITQYSQATKNRDAELQRDRQLKADLANTQKQRTDLEGEAKKASDIAAWIDSTRPLQPLVVEIARSVEPEASIIDLRLERSAENPTQIAFGLRLGSDSTRQLDITLVKIADQRFRAYSPQQTSGKGEIDYKATLLWQSSREIPAESKVTQ